MNFSENQKTVDKNDLFTVKNVSERKGFFNRVGARINFLFNKNFSETEQEYYNRQNAITWLRENTKYSESSLDFLDVNGNMKIINMVWPFFKVAILSVIGFIFIMKFLSFVRGNLLFIDWQTSLMTVILFTIYACGGILILSYMELKKEKKDEFFFKNKINIFKRVLNGEEISVQELYENRLLKIPGER